jgi:prepilin-type N-terminal cleavage/methylation domain-containing protein
VSRKTRRAGRQAGFTLVEVLVTVVVIGVLAAIAVPIYSNQRVKAVTATVQSDARANAGEIAATIADYTNNGAASAAWNVTATGTVMTITFGAGYAPSSLAASRTVKILLSPGNTLTGGLKANTSGYCVNAAQGSIHVVFDETGLRSGKTGCDANGNAI